MIARAVVLEALDPTPGSRWNTAIPPYGSPLRERWDTLAGAARAYVELRDELEDRRAELKERSVEHYDDGWTR